MEEIRRIRHEQYLKRKAEEDAKNKEIENNNKLKVFFAKYNFVYNKKELAAYRIQGFINKHLLVPTVNNLNIPGRFKYRIKETSLISENLYELLLETEKDYREILEVELLSSINNPNPSNVMIDIDIYEGKNIPVRYNEDIYYISTSEMHNIKKIWNKIDPNTDVGKKFHTMLDWSKELCNAYNLRLNK